ncbi:MAG: hypothetical protein U1D28_13985 [Burkholderiales bacterium]|nr:hypothetical protein [Burkholderiales bacterium]
MASRSSARAWVNASAWDIPASARHDMNAMVAMMAMATSNSTKVKPRAASARLGKELRRLRHSGRGMDEPVVASGAAMLSAVPPR